LKAEGNVHFRAQNWDEALVAYRTALGRLPKRKTSRKKSQEPVRDDDNDNDLVTDNSQASSDAESNAHDHEPEPPTQLDIECAKSRAILNANIAACYVKLGDHKLVVEACTEALLDDSKYIKALQRRASSNAKIGTWSSLSSAQEDYTTLLTLLPPSSSQAKETERTLSSLKPAVESAQKRETAEMMDKLKGLGNSVLGNFGLSLDNFKLDPNGQGGYSVNFSR